MNILKNFRNPWEAATEVLKTSVLDSKVLETKVLETGVLEGSVLGDTDLTQQSKDRGTHFYDETGNLIYKSKYGKGAAITILYTEMVEDFKFAFGLSKRIAVPFKPLKEDDEVIREYRKRYGVTYILKGMLAVYERSKTDKRTQYVARDDLYFTYSGNSSEKLLPKQPPVEVACPLFLNEYGEVVIGDYDTQLAIGNSPLHIHVPPIKKVKEEIGQYWVAFLHTEPVVGLKNVRENNGTASFDTDDRYPMCSEASEHDIRHYYQHEKQSPYFAVIIRPYNIVFFKGTVNEFAAALQTDFICIKKTDLL